MVTLSKYSTPRCIELKSTPCPLIGKILVTGASGYIGGRLIPELHERGYKLRLMVRSPSPEYFENWPYTEIVAADALNESELENALKGVHTAIYLIHSLLQGPSKFNDTDLKAAENFKLAAEKQGISHVIYLGGVGDSNSTLSKHLQSRIQVSQRLKSDKFKTTILKASIILGSGSASYEIIKNLSNKSRIFPVPDWVNRKCQPISIRDVIKYIVSVIEINQCQGKTMDIGGDEIYTYKEMIQIFSKILRKKVVFLPSPIKKIGLYAYIISLITPVPKPIVRCLMESVVNEAICQNNEISKYVDFKKISYKEALLRALSREEQDQISTRWSDSYPPAHELAIKKYELRQPPQYICSYSIESKKSAESLFLASSRIGGKEGWFNTNWMWKMRGTFDKLLGGVGMVRGRKSESRLSVNDVVDFWRVESIIHNKNILLRAEMKLPGYAWLEFQINDMETKRMLTIKPYFYTKSIFGRIYWYFFLPFHGVIFNDLIKNIEEKA